MAVSRQHRTEPPPAAKLSQQRLAFLTAEAGAVSAARLARPGYTKPALGPGWIFPAPNWEIDMA